MIHKNFVKKVIDKKIIDKCCQHKWIKSCYPKLVTKVVKKTVDIKIVDLLSTEKLCTQIVNNSCQQQLLTIVNFSCFKRGDRLGGWINSF